jgi:RNA polymerase sigma factor (TIGR02999 family)
LGSKSLKVGLSKMSQYCGKGRISKNRLQNERNVGYSLHENESFIPLLECCSCHQAKPRAVAWLTQNHLNQVRSLDFASGYQGRERIAAGRSWEGVAKSDYPKWRVELPCDKLSHSRSIFCYLQWNMAKAPSQQITRLLLAWGNGDQAAMEDLMPLVYDELRKLAARQLRNQRPGHTLQTTALVNEAYLRLIDSSQVRWQNRAHFFAVSAQLMRRILVDFARSRNYQKRGGGAERVSLDETLAFAPERGADLLALDEALDRLAKLNPRQAQVVVLRYFGGLSEEESAESLRVSLRTVQRDWNLARLWLYRELSRTSEQEAGGGKQEDEVNL